MIFACKPTRKAGIDTATTSFNNAFPFPTRKTLTKAIESFRPDVIEYWMGRAGQFAPEAYRSRSIGWYGGYYKLERLHQLRVAYRP